MNGEIGDLESEDKEKSFKSLRIRVKGGKLTKKEQFALSPCWSFKRCR